MRPLVLLAAFGFGVALGQSNHAINPFAYHGCSSLDLNCFSNPVDMNGGPLTPELCQQACEGHRFAALLPTSCRCGDDANAIKPLDEGVCNQPCMGDLSYGMCGGICPGEGPGTANVYTKTDVVVSQQLPDQTEQITSTLALPTASSTSAPCTSSQQAPVTITVQPTGDASSLPSQGPVTITVQPTGDASSLPSQGPEVLTTSPFVSTSSTPPIAYSETPSSPLTISDTPVGQAPGSSTTSGSVVVPSGSYAVYSATQDSSAQETNSVITLDIPPTGAPTTLTPALASSGAAPSSGATPSSPCQSASTCSGQESATPQQPTVVTVPAVTTGSSQGSGSLPPSTSSAAVPTTDQATTEAPTGFTSVAQSVSSPETYSDQYFSGQQATDTANSTSDLVHEAPSQSSASTSWSRPSDIVTPTGEPPVPVHVPGSDSTHTSQELQAEFNSLLSSSSPFGLLVGIEKESLVPLTRIPSKSASFSDNLPTLQSHLQPNVALYILLRRYEDAPRLAAITYVPDAAPVRQKMLFASTRLTLVRELGSEHFRETIFANSPDELTESGFRKHDAHTNMAAPLTEEEQTLWEVKRAEQEAGSGTGTREIHLSKSFAMPMADEAVAALKELAQDGGRTVAMLKINSEKESVELVPESPRPSTITELSSAISTSEPRFTFYRFKHTHNGAEQAPILFFYTCPVTPGNKSIKSRMLYPLMKRAVLDIAEKEAQLTLAKKFEVEEPSEITEQSVMEDLHPKQTSRTGFSRPKRPGR
ncbi:twinfilin-1 [Moelleriella libera RCEF 2490]|uniref:Twinfilin n=1 Tax=Moelleriella libera RCEF 2490 TaxID=1081109 RepID=A0A162IN44_9HYPO|nr:twinfilin-1 [Moelleriella libera RCEF 2490]